MAGSAHTNKGVRPCSRAEQHQEPEVTRWRRWRWTLSRRRCLFRCSTSRCWSTDWCPPGRWTSRAGKGTSRSLLDRGPCRSWPLGRPTSLQLSRPL